MAAVFNIKKLVSFSLVGILFSLFSSVVVAQQALPSTVQPSQVSQAISEQVAQGVPTVAPGARPVVTEAPQPGLPPTAAKLKLKLTQIKVVGATIFTPEQLTAPYRSQYGRTISVGDLDAMAKQMAMRYQNAGYILTRVVLPPQHITNGVVTFQVVEGFIDKVDVAGDLSYGDKDLLMRYAKHLQGKKPLNVKDLERYTLLANDVPGMTVKAVLNPSRTTPGAADLVLVTEEKRISEYFTVNNYGTKFIGPVQYFAGVNLNSIFMPGDSTGFQYTTTGNKELNYGQITHTELFGSEGLQLTVNANYTNTEPGSFLQPFDIVGISTSLNADLAYPLIRSRANTLYVHGGFNILDSQSNSPNPAVLSYNDHIRMLFLGLNYSTIDNWFQVGYNQVSFDVTQGLHVLDASGASNISRPNGKSDFTALHLNGSRLQTLPMNFSVFLNAQTQYAFEPLLAAEQIAYGGSIIGRGYDPAEITGDEGAGGTVELRYDWPLNLKFLQNTQYYAFYDIGAIWNRDTSSLPAQQSLASTGVGIRLGFTNYLSGNIYVAKPLTKVEVDTGNRNARFFFSLSVFG